MPKQRRPPVRRAPVRARRSTQTRRERWFAVVALLTVVALVIGAVGSAVLLDLFKDDGGANVIDVASDPEDDPVEQEFRDDLAGRPDDPDAMATLANYLSETGKMDEALPLFERALTIAPDDNGIRLLFAGALSDAGSGRDAELQYSKVIATEPANDVALLGLARLYRDWSPARTDEAIRTYQQVVATGGDSLSVQLATEELAELGVVAPVASPAASPLATPAV